MSEPNVYVDDGTGTLRRSVLVSEPNGRIIFQDNPNSANAYVEVNGQLHRVLLVANLGEADISGDDRIIVKSDTIPTASNDTYHKFYCYSGETNATYTHGYIYECKGTETYDIPIVYFDIAFFGFDYTFADPSENFHSDGEAMQGFLDLLLRNTEYTFDQVTAGVLTRGGDDLNEIWLVTLKDSDGNVLVENYQLYKDDLQHYGFVFIRPESEYIIGEPFPYHYTWVRSYSNLHWERIDVQPGGANLGVGFDPTKTQTLKNVNGVLTWVNG